MKRILLALITTLLLVCPLHANNLGPTFSGISVGRYLGVVGLLHSSQKRFIPVDVPQAEAKALISFYKTAGGSSWLNKTGWLSDTTIGNWYGVTVAGGHVTALNLQGNGLLTPYVTLLDPCTELASIVFSLPHYVDTAAADNSGDGSSSSPWRDVEYALEGNRTALGDTIYVSDSDNVIENVFIDKVSAGQYIQPAFSAGVGVTIVKPLVSTDITEIQIPTNCSTTYLFENTNEDLQLEGFKFTNPNSLTPMVFRVNSGHHLYFLDCHINMNNASSSNGVFYVNREGNKNYLHLERVKLEGANGQWVYLRAKSTDFETSCYIKSCLISEDVANVSWISINESSSIEEYNSTFINSAISDSDDFINLVSGVNTNFTAKNNNYIFTGTGINPVFLRIYPATTILTFDVLNNVWEAPNMTNGLVTTPVGFIRYEDELYPVDYTNLYVESGHTNGVIPSGSYACGRGNNSYRPDKALKLDESGNVVRGGENWIGNDIGCFKNGSSTSPTRTVVADQGIIFGDSISLFVAGTPDYGVPKAFNDLSAVKKLMTTNPGAIGGQRADYVGNLIDYQAVNNPSEFGYLCIGVSNLDSSGVSIPSSIDNEDLADEIIELLKKIEYWGMAPYWLGIPATKGPVTDRIIAINALVDAACASNGWKHDSIYTRMIDRVDWDTYYYDDIVNDVHPNVIGRTFIGQIAWELMNE